MHAASTAAAKREYNLANMIPSLPDIVNLLLRVRTARFCDASAAPPLRELLAKGGYHWNDAVAQFDLAFGWLAFPETAGDWDLDSGEGWMIGSSYCLSLGGHSFPRGGDAQVALGLVPIAYSPNDVIYYMDANGLCWGHDTIEEMDAVPAAQSGATLVARLILETEMWQATNKESFGDQRGAQLAQSLKLDLISGASDAWGRWWCSPQPVDGQYVFVAEYSAGQTAASDEDGDADQGHTYTFRAAIPHSDGA